MAPWSLPDKDFSVDQRVLGPGPPPPPSPPVSHGIMICMEPTCPLLCPLSQLLNFLQDNLKRQLLEKAFLGPPIGPSAVLRCS